ncbi:MAG TPA: heavy metal-binding domain-containing protein [Solirubrobacteraceae bacterium]|jgi:uncharacterized protein YbjQ (UPF0145 family)|nr:heavy metal-binding domain-containing protein [Solirubrobacteraceae bacterium]
MGFFSRGDRKDEEQSEALARIEQGGIPAGAERRLQELGHGGSLFTSGLSVREFALLDRMGPRPLAQVMGASVVRTGWQYLPPLDPVEVQASWYAGARAYGPTMSSRALQNRYAEPSWAQIRRYQWHGPVVCELDVLSDAWASARRRALDRLTEEALQVGADAVVGVHLRHSDHDFGKHTIEYVVTGTAIRLPGSDAKSWPVLTDLSLQDYWRLHSTGHDPLGLLATTSVVFASASRATRLRRLRTMNRNQELEELTRAFADARESVRGRLEGQVSDAHGEGAVGVELSHAIHRQKFSLASAVTSANLRGWHLGRLGIPYRVSGKGDVEREGWVVTMHGAGTAVRRRENPGPPPPLKAAFRMGGRK